MGLYKEWKSIFSEKGGSLYSEGFLASTDFMRKHFNKYKKKFFATMNKRTFSNTSPYLFRKKIYPTFAILLLFNLFLRDIGESCTLYLYDSTKSLYSQVITGLSYNGDLCNYESGKNRNYFLSCSCIR